jgi:DNA-binding response OmpR family regulator
VDVYIRRIRRKIEGNGSNTEIQTVRGLGYRLVVGSSFPETLPLTVGA